MTSVNRILAFVLILSALTSLSLNAESVAERAEYLRSFLGDIKNGRDVGHALGEPCEDCGKCGTPLFLEAAFLHREYGAVLGLAEVLARPDYPEVFDSPAGYFKIHFTTEAGTHQIDLSYGDHNANGVPDYAEIVARIADSVWDHHVNQLGYDPPPGDDIFSDGGDSRYDIYISNLSSRYYGWTKQDTVFVRDSRIQATSFIEVQNHYEILPGYAERPIEALQVTVAHEFFHAIQFAYDAHESLVSSGAIQEIEASWMEMTAVWMEEETFDNVNDYYYYLPKYMDEIHKSLLDFLANGNLHPYGAGIFPLFLAERFDKELIKVIWEHCADVAGPSFRMGAVQAGVDDYFGGATDFEAIWAEFAQWLYFTGDREPHFFSEGAAYYQVPDSVYVGSSSTPYIRSYSDLSEGVTVPLGFAFSPNDLAINYVHFDITTLDSSLTMDDFLLTTSRNPEVGWRFSVIVYNRFNPLVDVRVEDSLYREGDIIVVEDLEGYTDLVLALTVGNPLYIKKPNLYTFDVTAGTRVVETVSISPPFPAQFQVGLENPQIRVDLVENGTVNLDVFTVAGEKLHSSQSSGVANGQAIVLWDGRNEYGEEVAAGIYVMLVRVGDRSETFKVLAKR